MFRYNVGHNCFASAPSIGFFFQLLDPQTFIGLAPEQVDEFLREEVDPVLKKYPEQSLSEKVELKL